MLMTQDMATQYILHNCAALDHEGKEITLQAVSTLVLQGMRYTAPTAFVEQVVQERGEYRYSSASHRFEKAEEIQ